METSTFESSPIIFPNNGAQNVSNHSQMTILTAANSPLAPDYYEPLNRLFICCLVILIMIANVLMGAELDVSIIASTIKRPVAPAIGFFTQFFLMPLVSLLIMDKIWAFNILRLRDKTA
jgi:predicted Na+-dependent transporter